VLSNELKELEMNGFVQRKVYVQTPVLVEYELTEYSQTLGKVLQSRSEWGAMHRAHIQKEGRESNGSGRGNNPMEVAK